MTLLFANNAYGTLAGPITNTATSANLAAGTGALFPNPTAPDYFKMTLVDAATGLLNEIVHVTARSNDNITIVRAQEGTAAQNWLAGDLAQNLWTAGSARAMLQSVQQSGFFQGTDTATDSNNMTVPTVLPALTAPPAAGQIYFITKGSNPNTGNVKLLVGTGVTAGANQAVVYGDGSQLAPGDWPGTASAWLYYTGSVYQLLGLVRGVPPNALWHYGTATAGTSAAPTTTLNPAVVGPTAGLCFRVPISTTNTVGTSPATTTIDFGAGPKPIVLNQTGAFLVGGELPGGIGYDADFIYDGTYARLVNPFPILGSVPGVLINTQIFKTAGSTTYVPTPGTKSIVVTVEGAGGAGTGSGPNNGSGSYIMGGGGGGGGAAVSRISSGFSGQTITVGAKGVGIANNSPAAGGGSSSFGSFLSATGGGGGTLSNAIPNSNGGVQAGGAGGQGSGGNIANYPGQAGSYAAGNSNVNFVTGAGGGSLSGFGASPIYSSTGPGLNATVPGAGGSGGATSAGAGAQKGGDGSDGFVEIKEYA